MKTIYLIIPLLTISCLPAKLVPHDFSIEENNTQAFTTTDSVTLAIENLVAKGDHYVFDLFVENNRDIPVFIDLAKPRKYAHHLSYRKDDKDKLFPEVTSIMTAEQVNSFFEEKQKSAEAAAVFLFLLGAAITTYDAIKDDQESTKTSWTKEDERKSIARDMVVSTTLLATDILGEAANQSQSAAQAELRYLPEEVFDRTIIYPGDIYRGKILFKNFGEIKKHQRIIFPLENTDIHFDFRRATMKERRFLFEQTNQD